MVDEELLEEIADKYSSQSLTAEDIRPFMEVFCQIANENEEIQDEIDDEEFSNIKFQFQLEGIEPFTLVIEDKQFKIVDGLEEDWGAQLIMDASDFAELLNGKVDGNSLYMSGRLEAHGGLPRILKFQTIMEIVQEVLEEAA